MAIPSAVLTTAINFEIIIFCHPGPVFLLNLSSRNCECGEQYPGSRIRSILLLDPGSGPGRHYSFCHPGIANAVSNIRDPENERHSGPRPGIYDPIYLRDGPDAATSEAAGLGPEPIGEGRTPRVRADRCRSGPTCAARDRPEGGPGREPRPPAERSRGFPGDWKSPGLEIKILVPDLRPGRHSRATRTTKKTS